MSLAIDTDAALSALRKRQGSGAFAPAVKTLRDLCADDLNHVDNELIDCLASPVSMIPQLGGHLVKAGGKRLRPLLTLGVAAMHGYDGHNHIRLAAAVELIHGATLLHDDVVDKSSLRRGTSTANVLWGNKESVLVGDFIFSRSFELMVATGDLEVLKILAHAAGVIAEGEVLQLGTQKNIDTDFDTYLAVIDAKTAALFAAAAEVGAVISKAETSVIKAMRNYGRNLGIAYQLVDDALDYAGDEQALGKSVGDDFREGKMTLPIVYAISEASRNEKDFWKRTIANGNRSNEDFNTAREIISRHGIIDKTLGTARTYAEIALENLERAPQGPYSDAFAEIARQSVERAF
ncbi:MAG: polyprenyl synthetase family protein [Pseudomonadota bacterium]